MEMILNGFTSSLSASNPRKHAEDFLGFIFCADSDIGGRKGCWPEFTH